MTTALGSLPAAADDAPDCPWAHSDASPADRARQVLAQMTLDEKLSMTHGSQQPGYAGVIAPIPRLCVPALNLHDGGAGVTMGGTTALPAPIAAAATFDPSAEERYGAVVGQEAHTKGISVNLGPNVNLARDPRGGRIFEGAGEDPYLTGEMATSYVKGVQKQGVMADLKHIVANDVEQNRNNADSVVDERTLNEIYYPPFKQAVQEGHAASMMAATSLLNGTHANENHGLLQDTVKDGWGFDGFVVTDWDGARSTVRAADAGLDLTMPSAGNFGQALTDAVAQGKVSTKVIDDKVLRLLTKEFEYGLFGSTPGSPDATATTPEHVQTARDIAARGTVLMKNDRHGGRALLPLDDKSPQSLAVIGQAAGKSPITGGGGSSHVTPDPDSVVSIADGLTKRLGNSGSVDVSDGVPVPSATDILPAVPADRFTTDGHPGLRADYYDNLDLKGDPVVTRTEPNVDRTFDGAPAPGVDQDNFSVRYSGSLDAQVTGTYDFSMKNTGGVRVSIDGKPVIDDWAQYAPSLSSVRLTKGKHRITIENYQSAKGPEGPDAGQGQHDPAPPSPRRLSLGWQQPDVAAIKKAAEAAAEADTAVVVVNDNEGEDADRQNLTLPGAQDDMVAAVARANPNTVVVLNTGGPVLMPWLHSVRSVVESWYGGQENGAALASVLFGDVDPAGRLPQTWPSSMSQLPTADRSRYPGAVDPAKDSTTYHYSEKLGVGYRGYDARGTRPAFPFGHGLSYSTFAYRDLRVAPHGDGHGGLRVTATVRNTGTRTASDVAQLYVGFPRSSGEPPRQLKAFKKVELRPGQSRRITMTVPAARLRVWDTAAHDWSAPDGTFRVDVGNSSRNLPLTGQWRRHPAS